MPLVSIIIPLFNRRELISDTLQSIRTQSFDDLEILVVDDGSSDGGPEYVDSISLIDARIRLIRRSKQPQGAQQCRNIGSELATGKYVLFLDSDDLLGANCLRNRISCINCNTTQMVAIGQALVFDKFPGDSRKLWNAIPCPSTKNEEFLKSFLRQNMPFANGGPLWPREILKAIGPWNTELKCFQDWEYHIRACIEPISFTFLPTPDFFVRRNSGVTQISKKHNSYDHLQSRFLAIGSVISKIEKATSIRRSMRNEIKSLVLRNVLDLADSRHPDLLRRILASHIVKSRTTSFDRLLVKWLAARAPDWRWRSKYRFAPDLIWRHLEFDSSRLDITHMNRSWEGTIPI
jgi:glycosyltransferase involved in cell wall biosynthesis